jgi:acetyl-CoA carboxylase carboxyltransferase component
VDRKRAYSMHGILDLITDDATPFFEVGPHWGDSVITGFIRVQGQALGIVASNVLSALGGAVDAASAAKASRFMNVLTKTRAAHLLVLCDTPGFMVGPAAEPEGGLRAFAEYFARGADFVDKGGRIFGLTVRKAYGLGAQALLGGSTIVPFHSASWPTGEFAGMGIEGAVKLGMSKELEAIADPAERAAAEQAFIDDMYYRGRAVSMAQTTEIDAVIDPAETRGWLERCVASVEPRNGFTGRYHGRGESRL